MQGGLNTGESDRCVMWAVFTCGLVIGAADVGDSFGEDECCLLIKRSD